MSTSPPRLRRVLVADDHPSIRENLRALLNAEPDLEVVGVARNGLEALQMTRQLRPDVIVLDQEMPVLDGIEVAARLRREHATVHVVLYTMDDEHTQVSGAGGSVVSKDAPAGDLLRAIRQPAAHDTRPSARVRF